MPTVLQQQREAASASSSSTPPFPVGQSELTEIGKRLLADARKARGGNGADPLPVQKGFSHEEKLFIVENFAVFRHLQGVQDEFFKRFGYRPDLRWLEVYDPNCRRCRMGKRLRQHYADTRQAYIERTADVAVAHQAHRLRLIERLIDKATTAKEFNAAAKLLELAAKETGALIQHVEHKGTVQHAHVHATVEEAKAELAMRLQSMIDGGEVLPSAALPAPVEGESEPIHPLPHS